MSLSSKSGQATRQGFLRDEFKTGKQIRVLRQEKGSLTGPVERHSSKNLVLLSCLKFVSQETCLIACPGFLMNDLFLSLFFVDRSNCECKIFFGFS